MHDPESTHERPPSPERTHPIPLDDGEQDSAGRFVAEFATLREALDELVDALGWDPAFVSHDELNGTPDPVLEMLYRDLFDVIVTPDNRVRVYRR
ncbi:hypothetical protein HQQ81_19455 [Microbacteriaceae bacterium VKM Ac-2854]|nr:hypothetical protein [Microbacteriaceae bacterium VKM Ac-2854]